MARHWQRQPLLVRAALPGFRSPVRPDQLVRLAGRDDVESRLVRTVRGRWHLERGPFEPQAVPSLAQRHWTLLVQGVDLHLPPVHALLGRFRFISDARLDDLMISMAGDGGGVGPHLDAYDVFLLQASGRRRWRIAPTDYPRNPPALRDDVPLKMIEPFEATEEWVLEPGDMLYLPPGHAHEGIADGPCMTFSIGFRAPSRLEFLRAFLADSADDLAGADPRFTDPGIRATRHPGRLPTGLADTLQGWAQGWRPERQLIDRFIGRFLTEPKPQVWFEARPPGSLATFRRRLAGARLTLDPRSRMLYRGRLVYLNGEMFAGLDGTCMRKLADARCLSGEPLNRALSDPVLAGLLHQWWAAGWLQHHKGT